MLNSTYNVALAGLVLFIAVITVESMQEVIFRLNDVSLQEKIEEHEYLVVNFYAPWCTRCMIFAHEYAKAARTFHEEGRTDLRFAIIDGTIDIHLLKQYDIKSFPTIILFNATQPMNYTGEYKGEPMARWLRKRTKFPMSPLATLNDTKIFIGSTDLTAIGFFNDLESVAAKSFAQVAVTMDECPFGITNNSELYKEYHLEKDAVVTFKNTTNERYDLTEDLSAENIRAHILATSLPLIVEITPKNSELLYYSDIKHHIMLFDNEKPDNLTDAMDNYKKVAPAYKGKILFAYVDASDKRNEWLLSVFDLTKDELPAMRFVIKIDPIDKYKPQNPEVTVENIQKFISDVHDGTLTPHYKTEKIPAEWNLRPLKFVVGQHFRDVVLDTTKHVFVLFYSPWSGICLQLLPVWHKLAEMFKDNPDLTIALMDNTKNDIEGMPIPNVPTLKFFSKDNNTVVDYNGERTLDGLKDFLAEWMITDNKIEKDEL